MRRTKLCGHFGALQVHVDAVATLADLMVTSLLNLLAKNITSQKNMMQLTKLNVGGESFHPIFDSEIRLMWLKLFPCNFDVVFCQSSAS